MASWFVVFLYKCKLLCQNKFKIHKIGFYSPVLFPFWQIWKFNKINWTYCNSQTYTPHCVKSLKQQKYLFRNQFVTFVVSFFKLKPSHYLSEMSEEYHKHFKLCWLLFKLMLDQELVKYQYSTSSLHCHISIQYWEKMQCCNSLAAYVRFYLYVRCL